MSNLEITIINMGFLFSLLVFVSSYAAVKFAQKRTPEEDERFTAINRIGLVVIPVLFGIIITMIMISYSFNISIKGNDNDLANWTSLVIEIGLGIILGVGIFIYSHVEQMRSNKIIHEQKIKSEKRKDFAIEQIRYKLSFAFDVCPSGQALLNTGTIQDVKERTFQITDELSNLPYVIDELNNVQNIVSLYAEDLDPEDVIQITRITRYAQQFSRNSNFIDDRLWHPLNEFELALKEFFKKYPKLDWAEKQNEVLD